MVCDICNGSEATVHLTEIINGKVTELHLCEDCARKKGTQMEQHFGISDLLSGLADLSSPLETKQDISLKCGNCGLSYKDFKNSGRFGCSQCYEVFKKYIPSLLKRIHGSTKYVGEIPKTGEFKVVRDELHQLRKDLQDAVEKEEYEKAAQIRDQIKSIENAKAKEK
ncbi:MAG: UvrB/UvrC motif-containing protein [Candidatus Omnitrophica bacterium]|nr:UvrB/UvrC motif-containing protein [Candidatus Omnitrophota bacterium]